MDLGTRVVPSLLVQRMEESLAFYVEQLGFRLTGAHPTRENPSWAEVRRSGVTLQLYSDPPEKTPDQPVMSGTIYIYPEDVRALARELQDQVPFAWGPEVMDYGMREFARP